MGLAPLCLLACVLSTPIQVGEMPSSRYRLENVRYWQGFVGSPQARALLARNGFVVTEQQFASFSDAYAQTGVGRGDPFANDTRATRMPKFITVDSAWHAYHLVLQSAVGRLEERQARQLSKFSTLLRRRALERQGERPDIYRDLAAFATTGPLRSGECEEGSLNRKDGSLRTRAAFHWYASQVFRLDSRSETERAIHLALLIDGDNELRTLYEKLTAPYDALIGPPDGPDVRQYAALARKLIGGPADPAKIEAVLDAFLREAARLPKGSWSPDEQNALSATEFKGFRLLPPRRLPAAALLQRTSLAAKGRGTASGLEVFAVGPLACPSARRVLRASLGRAEHIEAVFQTALEPLPESLHGRTLELARTLQKPLPPNAPAALRTSLWRDKQVWTSLGALAEQQYLWRPHRERAGTISSFTSHERYGGQGGEPLGYVSPHAEFFRGLARLSREADTVLRAALKDDPANVAEADNRQDSPFTGFAAMCELLASTADKQLHGKPLDHEEYRLIRDYGARLDQFASPDFCSPASSEFAPSRIVSDDAASGSIPCRSLPVSPLCVLDAGVSSASIGKPSEVAPRVLYAAAARPEALYVILEINGQPVLHRGAVMSYREFERPLDQPLNDRAWGADVAAGRAPAPPAFTSAFRHGMSEDDVLALLRNGHAYPSAVHMSSRAVTRAMFAVLASEATQDTGWFVRQVCARATSEDIGELLALTKKLPVQFTGELAVRLESMDWSKHRAAVMELLHSEHPEQADAAAYLLARRPERIDIAALAANFPRQKPRVRRLYCYLAGKVAWPRQAGPATFLTYPARDRQAGDLLQQALKDDHEGVRYQAALSVIQRGTGRADIIDRLIAGSKDTNIVVAAAMVHALAEVRATRAAPSLLGHLEKVVRGKPISEEDVDGQQELLNQDVEHNSYPVMVLAGRAEPDYRAWPEIATLPEELINALGKLRHEPAAGLLREIVTARPKHRSDDEPSPPQYGPQALEALAKLNPKGKAELLLGVALDGKVETPTRTVAIAQLAELRDPARIERLLPLLTESQAAAPAAPDDPFGIPDEEQALCDAAMQAVAAACRGPAAPSGTPAAALRAKVEVRLRGMLDSVNGPAALNVLAEMELKDRETLLLKIISDKSAAVDLRVAALGAMRWQEPQRLSVVLPLLSEDLSGEHVQLWQAAIQVLVSADSSDTGSSQRDSLRKTLEPRLRPLLAGEHSQMAYEALQRLYGEDAAKFLTEVARNDKLSGELRVRALRELGWQGDLGCVKELLPLLDDVTEGENQIPLSHFAASAIASLLGDENADGYGMEPAAQGDFLGRVRQAVFDAGIK